MLVSTLDIKFLELGVVSKIMGKRDRVLDIIRKTT